MANVKHRHTDPSLESGVMDQVGKTDRYADDVKNKVTDHEGREIRAMSTDRVWVIRPPREGEDDDRGRPVVSVGPTVEEWTSLVEESRLREVEAERDRLQRAFSAASEAASKHGGRELELMDRVERPEAELQQVDTAR